MYGITCPLCKNSSLEKKDYKNKYSIFICLSCHLAFVHPMPTEKELNEFYSNSYFKGGTLGAGYSDYVSDQNIHLANAKRIMKLYKGSPKSLLDVGCAYGFLLDHARSLGWKVKGVDVAAEAIGFARNELNLDVIKGTVFSLNASSNSFDVCVSVGVLEHLINPLAVIKEISRILKPGGTLILMVASTPRKLLPLFRWKPPEHLFYFSHKSLKLMLEKSGFEIKKMFSPWFWYSLREILVRVKSYINIWFPRKIFRLPLKLRIPSHEFLVVAEKNKF